ncbi:hypothetical protein Micbo1qcDRAFT_180963 [Microdochium bolleyi]|uniref:Uncharacterized protein n=1 Tax=Microdochium bolleyi TaxID=196109 RepID=A0A136IK15_9PEZI|nr:hypothetical protein Micbo1qcDRAFT_180963 [Microdochium bolleyi]
MALAIVIQVLLAPSVFNTAATPTYSATGAVEKRANWRSVLRVHGLELATPYGEVTWSKKGARDSTKDLAWISRGLPVFYGGDAGLEGSDHRAERLSVGDDTVTDVPGDPEGWNWQMLDVDTGWYNSSPSSRTLRHHGRPGPQGKGQTGGARKRRRPARRQDGADTPSLRIRMRHKDPMERGGDKTEGADHRGPGPAVATMGRCGLTARQRYLGFREVGETKKYDAEGARRHARTTTTRNRRGSEMTPRKAAGAEPMNCRSPFWSLENALDKVLELPIEIGRAGDSSRLTGCITVVGIMVADCVSFGESVKEDVFSKSILPKLVIPNRRCRVRNVIKTYYDSLDTYPKFLVTRYLEQILEAWLIQHHAPGAEVALAEKQPSSFTGSVAQPPAPQRVYVATELLVACLVGTDDDETGHTHERASLSTLLLRRPPPDAVDPERPRPRNKIFTQRYKRDNVETNTAAHPSHGTINSRLLPPPIGSTTTSTEPVRIYLIRTIACSCSTVRQRAPAPIIDSSTCRVRRWISPTASRSAFLYFYSGSSLGSVASIIPDQLRPVLLTLLARRFVKLLVL